MGVSRPIGNIGTCRACGQPGHNAARGDHTKCSPSWLAAQEVLLGTANANAAAIKHGVAHQSVREVLRRIREARKQA